ncbi:MAG: hypothetical protein ATN31_07170 [Candidatus Epulonipiscioides saccharophilum]|nr:MAG: hypothetical protein ATN31_07170 [Epulopiscium sp. AS2M-Bin001]
MKKIKSVDIAEEHIKNLIVKGIYKENDFLPSEGQLAQDLQFSRSTIREAVRSLEMRGFLDRIHGKGIKIVDNSVSVISQSIEDMLTQQGNLLDDLFEMRMLLEPYSAERAATLRSDNDLKILSNYLNIMESSTSMDDSYYTADLNFHIQLAKISGNNILSGFVQAYSNVLQDLIILHSQDSSPIEQRFHYHRKVFEALKAQNPKNAKDSMVEHLIAAQNNKFYKASNN